MRWGPPQPVTILPKDCLREKKRLQTLETNYKTYYDSSDSSDMENDYDSKYYQKSVSNFREEGYDSRRDHRNFHNHNLSNHNLSNRDLRKSSMSNRSHDSYSPGYRSAFNNKTTYDNSQSKNHRNSNRIDYYNNSRPNHNSRSHHKSRSHHNSRSPHVYRDSGYNKTFHKSTLPGHGISEYDGAHDRHTFVEEQKYQLYDPHSLGSLGNFNDGYYNPSHKRDCYNHAKHKNPNKHGKNYYKGDEKDFEEMNKYNLHNKYTDKFITEPSRYDQSYVVVKIPLMQATIKAKVQPLTRIHDLIIHVCDKVKIDHMKSK